MNSDKAFNDAFDALCRAGWSYLGCDEWRDPQTNEKHMMVSAYKVMMQRAKPTAPKTRKPRLIHWQDWMGIAQELRKQLKPYGLTIKTRGHGDFLEWRVVKFINPEYEAYLRDCNERGIPT